MNERSYLRTSGTIFGVVALFHLMRVVNGWAFQAGPWAVPPWFSWMGTIFPAFLCVWAFRLASRSTR